MEDLSIDEITTVIEDAFDASISPKRMQRVDDNKLHLIFKADSAGYQKINKAVLSLKQRLDPELCDDADLPMTAKIVGTEFVQGKASMLTITAVNTSTVDGATLVAGTYQYEGVAFSQDERGKLAYSVNFDDRTGSGSITGITEAGNITLDKGSITARSFTNVDNTTITGSGIASTASSEKLGSGTYQLGFFGPNAEEIAGAVENNYGVVGFGGAKK